MPFGIGRGRKEDEEGQENAAPTGGESVNWPEKQEAAEPAEAPPPIEEPAEQPAAERPAAEQPAAEEPPAEQPTYEQPAAAEGNGAPEAEAEPEEERGRVAVASEPAREDDEEFKWHTGLKRPTGVPD